MVDLLALAVAERGLVDWWGCVGVGLDFQVEDVVAECLGGAEGGEEEGCAEGLAGFEELDWEVFLRLICIC